MPDKIIAAKLEVDTGSANQNIQEVNKNLNEVNKNLDETSKKSANTGKNIEGAGGSFSKLKSQIGALPGPLGQASQGVTSLGSAFKALLANPVGLVLTAIVGLLALLYKGFTNTFEGAQKVEQVFAGIRAAGQALLDSLGKIASAIKNIFTFNFKGAIQDIGEVVGAAKRGYTEMSKLTEEAQKLRREQSQNDLDAIERQAKLAELKEKATDENISLKERIRLGKELLAASEQNAKEDLDLARRTAENKIKQLTLEKDGERKNLEEINQIKAEQRKGEIENANELRAIRKQILRAEKEEDNERKELLKAEEERRKENLRKQKEYQAEQAKLLKERKELEEKYAKAKREAQEQEVKDLEDYGAKLAAEQARIDKAEADRLANNEKTRLENRKKLAELSSLDNPEDPQKKIDLINAQLALELNALADGDIQKQILAKKASDAIVKIKQDEVNAKIALAEVERQAQEEKISAISQAFGNLSAIAGKQTAVGKAFAIIQTTIDTYQSAISSYKSLSGIPVVGPALGAIAAAAAISNGIATVKKITAIQVPGGGGGTAPTISGAAPAAPLAPQARSTTINQDQINQIGNATVRAFILDSDVQNNQERNTRLNRAARLGG